MRTPTIMALWALVLVGWHQTHAVTTPCPSDAPFFSCGNNDSPEMGYRVSGAYKLASYYDIPDQISDQFDATRFASSTIVRLDVQIKVPFTGPDKADFQHLFCQISTDDWIVVGDGADSPECGFDQCRNSDLSHCLVMSKSMNLNLVYDRARWFVPLLSRDLIFPFDYMVFKRLLDYALPDYDQEEGERFCMTNRNPSSSPSSPEGFGYFACNCATSASAVPSNPCCSTTRTPGTCPATPELSPERFQYSHGHSYFFTGNGASFDTYTCSNTGTGVQNGCPPSQLNPIPAQYPNMYVFPESISVGSPSRPLTPRDVYDSLLDKRPTCLIADSNTCKLTTPLSSRGIFTYADPQITLCQAPPPLDPSQYPFPQPGATPAPGVPRTLLDPALYAELVNDTTRYWTVPGDQNVDPTNAKTYSLPYSALSCGMCYPGDAHCNSDAISLAALRFFLFGVKPVCYSSRFSTEQVGVGFELSTSVSSGSTAFNNQTLTLLLHRGTQPHQVEPLTSGSARDVLAVMVNFDSPGLGDDAFFSNDISKNFEDLFGMVYCTNTYDGLTSEVTWQNNNTAPSSASNKYIPIPGLTYKPFPWAQIIGTSTDDLCPGCTPKSQLRAVGDKARLWFTLDSAAYKQMSSTDKCTGEGGEQGCFDITTNWLSTVPGLQDPLNPTPQTSVCLSMPGFTQTPQMCRPVNQGTASSTSPCGVTASFQQWEDAWDAGSITQANWPFYSASAFMSTDFDNSIMPTQWLESFPLQGLFVQYPPYTGPPENNPYQSQIITLSYYVNLTAHSVSLNSPGSVFPLDIVVPSSTTSNNLCPLVGAAAFSCNPNTAQTKALCGVLSYTLSMTGATNSSVGSYTAD